MRHLAALCGGNFSQNVCRSRFMLHSNGRFIFFLQTLLQSEVTFHVGMILYITFVAGIMVQGRQAFLTHVFQGGCPLFTTSHELSFSVSSHNKTNTNKLTNNNNNNETKQKKGDNHNSWIQK